MERLTRRMCGGYGMAYGHELNTVQGMRDAVNRLAAYEDTGLEPDEITDFLPTLKEWRQNMGALRHVHELVTAEAEGRLLVLPCKVGDVVYQRDSYGNLYEATVQSIVIDNRRTIFITSGIGFDCDAIGKSVFLSPEEAEKAVKQEGE